MGINITDAKNIPMGSWPARLEGYTLTVTTRIATYTLEVAEDQGIRGTATGTFYRVSGNGGVFVAA